MPLPRLWGSGALKILFLPELLHDKVFHIIIFLSYSRKPILGFLLWGAILDYTVIIYYAARSI
jgi:hypothetical protein